MLIFQSHSKNIIQYDMISQFAYKNNYITPELDKIVLSFGIKEVNFKLLLLVMATLEMISTQKPMITKSKKSNIFFKIRKGAPIGCKVCLQKKTMQHFISTILLKTLSNIKLFEGIKIKKDIPQNKSFSFSIYDLLIFPELELHYDIFQKIPKLDISIISSKTNLKEFNNLLANARFILKIA